MDPFTNPLSEAGIHALTVSGLTPAPPPIIVVPVDPALPPVIDESALVAAQLAALQRVEKTDASEASSGQLCDDHSGAVTSDSRSMLSTQTACKQPNRLIMPAETARASDGSHRIDKIELTPGFVDDHGGRVSKIKTTAARQHR